MGRSYLSGRQLRYQLSGLCLAVVIAGEAIAESVVLPFLINRPSTADAPSRSTTVAAREDPLLESDHRQQESTLTGQSAQVAPAANWMTACAPIPPSYAKGKENIRFEHCLRSFRFRRLAGEQAVAAPLIEALDLTAGVIPDIDYDVPALRLAWENQTFFDSNDDQLIEGVLPILDLVASAVHRDIGDVQLYVVGHTDSRGADDYNQGLSRRRGRAVVERLSAAGIPSHQMTYTGMGERQPVASNSTEAGQALNRRVEFVISAFRRVNHELVAMRAVNEAWLNDHPHHILIHDLPYNRKVEIYDLSNVDEPHEIFDLPEPVAHSIEEGPFEGGASTNER